jgi:hypothetical protein
MGGVYVGRIMGRMGGVYVVNIMWRMEDVDRKYFGLAVRGLYSKYYGQMEAICIGRRQCREYMDKSEVYLWLTGWLIRGSSPGRCWKFFSPPQRPERL